MPKYQNVVSLGFFCSPAIELNNLNLRKSSQPFDWLISSKFNQVLELINNGFEDFLNPDFYFNSNNIQGIIEILNMILIFIMILMS